MRHRTIDKICRRKSDSTLWRPSYRDGYNAGQAMADMFSGRAHFYFRRIVRVKRRFWFDYWEDTGDIWQPESGEFDVLSHKEALRV